MVTIEFTANTQQVQIELQDVGTKVEYQRQNVHQVITEAKVAEQQTNMTVMTSLSLINSVVGMMRGVIRMFGDLVDPIGEMVLSIIGTVVMTLMSIAAALSSTGYLAAIGVSMAIVAGIFQFVAVTEAQANLQQIAATAGAIANIARGA